MQERNLGLNLGLKSGHPSLEFTNTVDNHASDQPGETLFQYEDVLVWGKRVGLLRAEQASICSVTGPARSYLQNFRRADKGSSARAGGLEGSEFRVVAPDPRRASGACCRPI
jgi:hypothetical protein